ncbi:class II aldolase/adducin family protein [Bradyrhizobium sp. Cp5.3]|uniref:class II aldolase/adducin family protein n=1 Tax=Bradyrhizobium sp. Cp5.3 TaxID=443598 RepID=UPI0003FA3542|nr:class II aldolase/adducin family protein [Bradyrhizobium sp. Cp5.3]
MMTAHPNQAIATDTMRQIRVDLAAAYRLIHRLGLDDSIYTHISARLPGDHERFLINPFGMRFDEVTASSLVTINIDGTVVDDPLGLGINPAGFNIHATIHSARKDAMCVLHTHTIAGVAVSSLKAGLRPLTQWSLQFIDSLAYHDYGKIALDIGERARLVADLGDRSVMILRNHGLLTCGRSVAESFKLMRNLERSCQAQLAIQAAGGDFTVITEATARRAAQQYASFYDGIEAGETPDVEWAAFRRLLERTDPDFMN